MKLASMGWKGKLQYIWAYYKPQMAAIVAVIAIAFFVKDLYEFQDPYSTYGYGN